jgi:hypothetical protein
MNSILATHRAIDENDNWLLVPAKFVQPFDAGFCFAAVQRVLTREDVILPEVTNFIHSFLLQFI